MNLSFVKNQVNNTVIMNLYKPIVKGDGSMFADQLLYLEECGITKIDAQINSPGGDLFEGFSIFSSIRNCNLRGKCEVNTNVDYIAASIAGVFALAGKNRRIVSNGRFMMHNVSGPDSTDKEKEVLESLKKTIVDVFSTFPGNTSEMISKLMDEETWLNAEEAIRMGFFHSSFPALVPDQPTNKSILELYEYSNSILVNPNKNIDMDQKEIDALKAKQTELENKLNTVLDENKKLKDEAAEKEALQNKLTEATEKLTAVQEKLAERDKEIKDKSEKEGAELVETAIANGLIDKKFKDENLAMAKKDPEGYKNILKSLKGNNPARFTNVAGSGEGNKGKDENDRETWTYRDWEKKAPQELENLYKSDPDKAQQMYNAYYLNK